MRQNDKHASHEFQLTIGRLTNVFLISIYSESVTADSNLLNLDR